MYKKGIVIVTNYILVFLVLFFLVAGSYWLYSFYEKKVEKQRECAAYYNDAYNLRKVLLSSVKSENSNVTFEATRDFFISGKFINYICNNFNYSVPLIVSSCDSYTINQLTLYTATFNGSCIELLSS